MAKKIFLNDWKRASGYRRWIDFWNKEFNVKFSWLKNMMNEAARELGYEGDAGLSVIDSGLQATLLVGLTVNGRNVATHKSFMFPANATALVKDFETEGTKIVATFKRFVEDFKQSNCNTPYYRSGFGEVA